MKNINIIGIHFGHNSTVCLLQNGKITYCLSEERFDRIKNSTGFPGQALDFILKRVEEPIDYFVFSQQYAMGYKFFKKHNFRSMPYNLAYSELKQKIPLKLKIAPSLFYKDEMKRIKRSIEETKNDNQAKEEMEEYFSGLLKVEKERILYADHHLSHALSGIFFLDDINSERLIFTLDGEGDGLCASVNILKNGKLETISKTDRVHSLGYLYREVTAFLGMKPDEHEFKVMGLAPYAKPEHVQKIIPIFNELIWLNKKDEFCSNLPMPSIKYCLKDKLTYRRFDNVAGAIQQFTEEITMEWIKRWVNKIGIKKIALAGGVFMNVKMNQRISELNEVESITIVPSAGDETTAIGACYFGYEKYCTVNGHHPNIEKLDHLYLGTEYSNTEIEQFLINNSYFDKYKILHLENINKKIAELLSENKVVARCTGKMEFGARALGNRSILANPSSFENVKIINEMIKNRDFWMPFATSILEEDAPRYIINPKRTEAPFMAITFDTTQLAYEHLQAALHPYDKTSRPQIVKKETNPEYYEIINEFKKITGIGGILNTSFNLHGEPNVESPKDAIYTFENSGLEYLAMGNFLIIK